MPTRFDAIIRFLLVVVVLVLLIGSLAACNPAPAAPSPGTYSTRLVEADMPTELPEEVRGFLQGSWEIVLGNDQLFQVIKDGEIAIEGSFTATQDQIVFTDEEGPAAEPESGPGTYEWHSDGQTLTLTLIDDTSLGRILVATAHPLTKQE